MGSVASAIRCLSGGVCLPSPAPRERGMGGVRPQAPGPRTAPRVRLSLSPLLTDKQHSSPGLQEFRLVRVYKDPSPSSLADPTDSMV